MRRRKGNIMDIAMAMVILFTAAIIFLTVKYSYTEFVNIAINNTMVNDSAAAVTALEETRDLTNRFDYILFMLLMGFTLAILVVAWFASSHPLFAFVYFIALVLLTAVSAVLSFVWGRVTDQPIFEEVVTQLPIINFILDNFPIYIVLIGFIGMMIMFAKPSFTG